MLMNKRDVTDTVLVVFGVCCFLAIASIVAAVHIGLVQF